MRQRPAGSVPVATASVPEIHVDRAVLFLVPDIEEVAAKARQIALGQMRDVLLANFLLVEEAAVLFEARVRFDPRRRVGWIVPRRVRRIDAPEEGRVEDDLVIDLPRFFMQPPGERRLRLHARGGDRDGERLPPREAR